MGLIDFLMLPAALAGIAACVCRLDALRIGRHSTVVILLHAALGISCIFAAYHAWNGATDAQDVASTLAALAWVFLSMPTWGQGKVPRQFETKPGDLQDTRPMERQS